jgi:prolyl 4-hydroxylase
VANWQAVISTDWVNWIKENLHNGIPDAELRQIMVSKGLPASEVSDAVNAVIAGDPLTMELAGHEYQYTDSYGVYPENYIDIQDHRIFVTMTIDRPRIAIFDNVATAAECDALIEAARRKLTQSTVVDPDTGIARFDENRVSEGGHFEHDETPVVTTVEQRIMQLLKWPIEQSESLQILHYKNSGRYDPHYDFFAPEQEGSKVHLAHGGQRVATLILYLNTTEGGGETIFPHLNLKIKPKQGRACFFSYTNAAGQVDRQTFHGGMPVTAGEKWIVTKWTRQSTR